MTRSRRRFGHRGAFSMCGCALSLILSAVSIHSALAAPSTILPANLIDRKLTPVAFIGVDVVPMDSERVLRNQTVIVRNGKIERIGPAQTTEVALTIPRVLCRGRYMVPGLADMHVHLHNDDDLPLYVANGITTIRVMGGTESTLSYRQRIRENSLLGPTIHTAGPMIDGPPPVWPQADVLTDPRDADRLVRSYRERGYDFVKVYVGLSSYSYAAVVRAAKKYGIRTVGHVPYEVALEKVLRSGQVSVEHLDGYIEAIQTDESPYRGKSDVDARLFGVDHVDEQKIVEIAKATAKAGVWNCPTLVVEQNWCTAMHAAPRLESSEMKYMMPSTVRWWRTHSGLNLSEATRNYVDRLFDVRKRLVRAIHEEGGKILAGSDSPNPLIVHGFALHDELAYLRETGLSNFEVLRAATTNPAEFLRTKRHNTTWGTITPGARADLLIIDGNPLEDLSHLATPRGVVLRGSWYPRESLEMMLEHVCQERLQDRGGRGRRGR